MVADGEILLDQPLLSESEDELLHSEDESESEVNEDIYDAEYFMKLNQLRLLVIMNTILLAAPLVYCIWYGVTLPVPFYCTYQVFGYPVLWVVAIVLFMFALGYTEFDSWRSRPVVKDD